MAVSALCAYCGAATEIDAPRPLYVCDDGTLADEPGACRACGRALLRAEQVATTTTCSGCGARLVRLVDGIDYDSDRA